jgi:hypothetical protein
LNANKHIPSFSNYNTNVNKDVSTVEHEALSERRSSYGGVTDYQRP